MVRIISLLSAAALLSSSVLAAPVKRQQDVAGCGDNCNPDPMPEPVMPEEPMPEEPMPEEPMPEEPMPEEPMPEEPMPEEPMPEEPMPEEPMPEEPMPVEDCTDDSCMPEESTTVEETEIEEPTSTHPSEPAPTYGSGSSNWGSYEECVSQCMAQYPPEPPTEYTPPTEHETTMPDGGNIHYVYVAPVDGVLRYVPWALNATMGDTVRFVWSGTKEHSVTLGSELNLCNKSEAVDSFDSGLLSGAEGEQTFDITIDSEDPKYFYCSKGDHCSKGMWGVINPATQFGGDNTVGALMPEWAAADPNIKAAWSLVNEQTSGTPAENWGNNISLDNIPEDQYANVASNLLYTRATLAANTGMQENGLGAVTPDGSPISFPADIPNLIAQSNTAPGNAEAIANSESPEASAPPAAEPTGSASTTSVSAAAVSVFALVAAIFVL